MTSTVGTLLTGIDELRAKHQQINHPVAKAGVNVDRWLTALRSFGECVRYLNTRRSGGARLNLDSEAAVQDVLYLMLRPWVADLIPESPTEKIANRFSIKDFVSQSSRVVLEAKYVRNAEHGKSIVKELNDDIETYRYHPYCDDLIFFIYDPDGFIPDAGALERHLCSSRRYEEKTLKCHVVIKP
jgi:REase_DpnII-MboI